MLEEVGRKQRKEDRRQRRCQIELKVNKLMEERLPVFLESDYVENEYIKFTDEIKEEIRPYCLSANEYAYGCRTISRFINQGNKLGKWSLFIPDNPVRVTREYPLRTEMWFKDSILHATKYYKFEQWFKDQQQELHDLEIILGLILYSSACNGALAEADALVALANRIHEFKSLRYTEELNQISIDLTYKANVISNIKDGNKRYLMRRWFSDPVTLGLINVYRKCCGLMADNKTEYDQQLVLKIINNSLETIGIKEPKYVSLNSLCRVAPSVIESKDGVSIPEAIFEWSIGRVKSASMTSDWWGQVINNVQYNSVNLEFKDFDRLQINRISKSKKIDKDNDVSVLYDSLSHTLNSKDKYGKRLSKENAILRLKELLVDADETIFEYLIKWYIYLLDSKNNTLGTAYQYHTSIAKELTIKLSGCDLSDFDENNFLEIYEDIIDSNKTIERKSYIAGRINQLHEFCVMECEFPILNGPLIDFKNGSVFVRTGYVNERLYKALRQSIQTMTGLDEASRLGLEVLIILVYRLGLRPSEAVKIKLEDIEYSNEYWVRIKPNEYGANKNNPSKRKLPTCVVLKHDEMKLFKQYYGFRQQMARTPDQLLFVRTGAENIPWNTRVISDLVGKTLRAITGFDGYVFYHFRHTALSRMQLIIEDEWELLEKLSVYSKEEALKIKQAVVKEGDVTRDRYYALARFAGHSDPVTTFQSYLHLNDLILAKKIDRQETAYTINQLKNMTGLTSNMLTRIAKDNHVSKDAIPIKLLRDKLIETLLPFTTKKRVSKSPILEENDYEHVFKTRPDVQTCYKVLEQYIEGIPITELVYKYDLNEKLIYKWILASQMIAGLKTRSGKPRHVGDDRKKNIEKAFLPAQLRHKGELLEATKIIQELRKIYVNSKDNVLEITKYSLNNMHMSKSGIHFTDKKILKLLVELMTGVIAGRRWLIIVRSPENKQDQDIIRHWKVSDKVQVRIENRQIKNIKKYPWGSAQLYLRHADERELKEKISSDAMKYSASTFRYVFCMLGIMLLSADDLDIK